MSRGARILLAVAALVSGVLLAVSASVTTKPVGVYAAAAFCFVLALACLTRGHAALLFGSIVGSGVFVAACWYLVSMMGKVEPYSHDRAEPSMRSALLFMVFFGLPGAGYAWWAGFGLRRRGADRDPARHFDRAS